MFSRSNSAAEQLTAVWNLCHPQAALNALITHQFDSPRSLTRRYALADMINRFLTEKADGLSVFEQVHIPSAVELIRNNTTPERCYRKQCLRQIQALSQHFQRCRIPVFRKTGYPSSTIRLLFPPVVFAHPVVSRNLRDSYSAMQGKMKRQKTALSAYRSLLSAHYRNEIRMRNSTRPKKGRLNCRLLRSATIPNRLSTALL